jgi:hypothetical protein
MNANVGSLEIGSHLADGIADHHRSVVGDGCVVAAARERNGALPQEIRECREPLRMARDDHRQRTRRQRMRRERIEDQSLFAVARGGCDPRGARFAEAAA